MSRTPHPNDVPGAWRTAEPTPGEARWRSTVGGYPIVLCCDVRTRRWRATLDEPGALTTRRTRDYRTARAALDELRAAVAAAERHARPDDARLATSYGAHVSWGHYGARYHSPVREVTRPTTRAALAEAERQLTRALDSVRAARAAIEATG